MSAGQPQALVAAPQATKPNIVLILAGARFDAPSTVMRPNSVMKNLFLNLKHTMKHTMKHIFLALSLTASLAQPAPVKLVFDTDMGNDVDDLMALCMIHNLRQRGACELLAVTITKDHPQAAAFTDAVNTFFGAPDTPVGVVRNGVTPEPGKFNRLADEKNADGSFRYPHDRPTWDPTALLYAVYPDRGYFDLSPPGAVTVEDNGATWFRASREGKGPHRFLVS